jgi:hypothetical protein
MRVKPKKQHLNNNGMLSKLYCLYIGIRIGRKPPFGFIAEYACTCTRRYYAGTLPKGHWFSRYHDHY